VGKTSRINPRALSWNIAGGIGYSFILTVIMALTSIVLKGFYPPFPFIIAPLKSLVESPVEGVVQILVILALVLFVLPVRSVTASKELRSVRRLAIYTVVGFLVFSLLPYAFTVPYVQTYVGLVIAFNVINGVVAGFVSGL